MSLINLLSIIGKLAIPIFILLLLITALFKKVDVFSSFLTGAKEGLQTVYSICPVLVGLLAAIGVFKESGALSCLTNLLEPICSIIKLPAEVLPLVLIRPISGSAALAYLAGILQTYGPDTYIGMLSCVLMGSTETIFYTTSVYLGSIGIKHTKKTIPIILLIELISVFISFQLCSIILI